MKVYVLYQYFPLDVACSEPKDVVLSEAEAKAWREQDPYGQYKEFDATTLGALSLTVGQSKTAEDTAIP